MGGEYVVLLIPIGMQILKLFMLCITDQGEVWERMQGMFSINTSNHGYAAYNIVKFKIETLCSL